ncbi:MAG: YqaA family protein [Pseudomonadota bacterium]
MIRSLYDWTMAWAAHRYATFVLAVVSFIESSVFPIPPDVLLVPMVLAERAKAWFYAAVCTLASVAGGLAGYLIGAFFFESLAQPVLEAYGYTDAFASFTTRYNEWGAWIVFIAGVTPFPYKVVTIASGATGLSLPVFIVASIVARGLRFFLVAAILWWVGPPARAFIEKRLGILFALFCALLVGGFAVVKWLA